MQTIVDDPLMIVLSHCDLSVCARVCVRLRDLSGRLQSRCDGVNCGLMHPQCALRRPFDVAVLAVRRDHPGLLRWLLRNDACDREVLKWFCSIRWDLYKNIYKMWNSLSFRLKLPALPLTDIEFIHACHVGRKILPPFNATLRALPLRGLAAAHATKYNLDAQILTFHPRIFHALHRFNPPRIDISKQFHEHDFEAIKTQIGARLDTKYVYIAALSTHVAICDDLHRCNCINICAWLVSRNLLVKICNDQVELLKSHMKMLNII